MDNGLNNESPNEIMAEAPKRENPVAKNKQDIMAEIPPDSGSAKDCHQTSGAECGSAGPMVLGIGSSYSIGIRLPVLKFNLTRD